MSSPELLPPSLLYNAHRLRAEALLAHVVARGYPREGFAIGTGKFFERTYVNDLTGAVWQPDKWRVDASPGEASPGGLVRVQLSRPGFYDLLPEGLFFQPAGSEYNSQLGMAEAAALHRWNKNRENGIRSFFQPFEHAGFYQLLQLEEEERRLQQGLEQGWETGAENEKGLESGMLHRYFRVFWNIPDAVDDVAAGVFNLLIPHAYRITGCLPLMQQSLGLLLGFPTRIDILPPKPIRIDRELEKGLGEQSLGDDTVCGSHFVEGYPVYQYAMGPLAASEVSSFLPGGARYAVIETFNRFFVPAEADAEMEIGIDRSTVEMRLEPGREPVLGYSTLLSDLD